MEDRGWSITFTLTYEEPAPKTLKETVMCNCKMGCSRQKCTCRKHALVHPHVDSTQELHVTIHHKETSTMMVMSYYYTAKVNMRKLIYLPIFMFATT